VELFTEQARQASPARARPSSSTTPAPLFLRAVTPTVAGVRGRLHLEGEDRVVELRGRVAKHSDTRFSWHIHLSSYEGWRGRLMIDGDGQYDVTVTGAYLDELQ
jgi:hypothetical protein